MSKKRKKEKKVNNKGKSSRRVKNVPLTDKCPKDMDYVNDWS